MFSQRTPSSRGCRNQSPAVRRTSSSPSRAPAAEQTVISVNESLARGYFAALTQLKDMFSLEGEITADDACEVPRRADGDARGGGSRGRLGRHLSPCWTRRSPPTAACARSRARSWRRTCWAGPDTIESHRRPGGGALAADGRGVPPEARGQDVRAAAVDRPSTSRAC